VAAINAFNDKIESATELAFEASASRNRRIEV
jgi:hypothetical protein